jgi:hypothetical protein
MKCHVDLTEDGLLALEARGGVAVTGRSLAVLVGAASSSGGGNGGGGAPGRGRKVGGGGGGGGRSGGGGGAGADALRAFAGAAELTGRLELTQVILGFNVRVRETRGRGAGGARAILTRAVCALVALFVPFAGDAGREAGRGL